MSAPNSLPLRCSSGHSRVVGSGRASAGAPFTLRLATATQAAATPSRVTAVSLDFSADDGATWQAVRVNDDGGGRWCAELTNPATGQGSGFVSLRVRATNAVGNSVEQSIIRAYGLKR